MKRYITALTVAVALTGCVSIQKPIAPEQVRNMPADCANKKFFIEYLEGQLSLGKPIYMTQANYNANVAAIKEKIWILRYSCQPL